MSMKYWILSSILLIGILVLGACAPGEANLPNTGSNGDGEIEGLQDLETALEEANVSVERGGTLDQPFFDVDAQILTVEGSDVQVFEFPDVGLREDASESIASDASTIGTMMPTWIDVPNFWVSGRLIVLYVGTDQAVISALSSELGAPVASGTGGSVDLTAPAIVAALTQVSSELGVALTDLQVISAEPVEWPDACLGLAGQDEACAEVITPGFRVVVEADGQRITLRTDENGLNIRQE